MRTARIAAATALALLAGAAPAMADSIAFVKDNNVWIAAPDGSNVHQITRDGTATVAYRSPAEDDQGVIVAGHGNEIVRMRQSGEVLSHFDPPPAVDSTGETIDGTPVNVAVSPDGARIAFDYATYTCPPGDVGCGARQVLLYSYADRATPVSTFGVQFDLRYPSWIDNARVLEYGGHFRQVNIDSPGGGDDDASYWFDDAGNEDVGDGELSRQGDRLAEVRSYGENTHIAVLSVNGGPGGSVQYACFTGTDEALASPTWSPDGRALAFADGDGIEVLPLPDVVPGACPGATSSRVVVPGAAEPDWSPAAVAADAGSYQTGSTSGGTGGSGGSGGSGGGRGGSSGGSGGSFGGHGVSSRHVRVSAPRTARRPAVLRKGVAVRVKAPAAGRVAVRATLAGHTTGSRAVRLRKAGGVALRVRLARSGARYLRRHAHAVMTVRVTFTPRTGRASRDMARVRITR